MVCLSLTTLATVFTLASEARAALSSTCPKSDVCFQLNVPNATASTGSGDVFFQISASTSYEWVGLGQGSQMSGSNMFVIYSSANGQNVTLSPRLGTGHNMPSHDKAAQVSLLEGSGISNNTMTANIRCSNCNAWSGGSMDFTGSSSNWIYGSRTGSAMNTDDVTASISQHNGQGAFGWDLSKAKGGSDANPFMIDAATGTSPSPALTGTASTSTASPETDESSATKGVSQVMLLAHGILASVAFVAIFPLGGIIIRVVNSKTTIWMHAGLQMLGYAMFLAAFGLGIAMAMNADYMNNGHSQLGIAIFAIILLQPAFGMLHHQLYKKYQQRTLWSHVHLWIGRIAIVLGIINGGTGLTLGHASNSGKIAYGVCAAVMGATYLAAAIYGEIRRVQTNRMAARDDGKGFVMADQSHRGRESDSSHPWA